MVTGDRREAWLEIDVSEPKVPGTREWVTQQTEGSCGWGKVGRRVFPLPEGESETAEEDRWRLNGGRGHGTEKDLSSQSGKDRHGNECIRCCLTKQEQGRGLETARCPCGKGSEETWRDSSPPLQLLLQFLAPMAGGPQLQLRGSDRFLGLPRT